MRVIHAERGRRLVHFRHEGRHAAGVPTGQRAGVVVGRVDEHAAEQILLTDLLAQGHLSVGLVADGIGVVVVHVGLVDGDRRGRSGPVAKGDHAK